MNLVKIILTLMSTSISAKCIFSIFDRVKSKLRNSLSNEKMSNLVIINFYPDMVLMIDIISLCNKFAQQTLTTRRIDK